MLKNKKSLAVILSLAMLLGMACGAWAVTGQQVAVGSDADPAKRSITIADDIVTTANDIPGRGIVATIGGTITNPGYNIETSGDKAHGAWARRASSIDMKGDILTKGPEAHGALADSGSYIKLEGDVTTRGATAFGFVGYDDTGAAFGDTIGVLQGNVITSGDKADAVAADGTDVYLYITGDITTHGEDAHGIRAVNTATVTMTDGTIAVMGNGSPYGLWVALDGIINLDGVTADVKNLLRCGREATASETKVPGSGIVNITNSELTGDVLHVGTSDGTLDITYSDGTTWTGTAIASGDIGTINITLDESTWNVTGDSNTNGNVTADANSTIDYNTAPAGTVVVIDTLTGNPTIDMKPGDELIIKSGDSVISLESSDPDVVEIVENGDGSISIISRGEGEAELTYTYEDEDGNEQTVTIGVTGSDSLITTTEGTPDLDKITQGDDVEITYSFDSAVSDLVVGDVDGAGLVGSGLSVEKDAEGNIVLSGTADEPGNYFFEVDMIIDGEQVTRKFPVNVAAPFTTEGMPDSGIETDTQVEIEYDFTPYLPILIDNFGMAGSGLLADIVGGKVVLTGTAGNPGSYYYVVTLERADGSTFTQKVPVTIFGKSNPDVRGGGSSNCNAGMGIGALVSLLGLALVMRKK